MDHYLRHPIGPLGRGCVDTGAACHAGRPHRSAEIGMNYREPAGAWGSARLATALISSEQDCQLERAGTADQSRDPCHRRMTVVSVPGRPQTSVSTASNVESLVKRPMKVASLN